MLRLEIEAATQIKADVWRHLIVIHARVIVQCRKDGHIKGIHSGVFACSHGLPVTGLPGVKASISFSVRRSRTGAQDTSKARRKHDIGTNNCFITLSIINLTLLQISQSAH